jgi:proline dehydrogenase
MQSMSYGELSECIAFLSRRANENKAILSGRGGALSERKRLGREIQRRLSPFGARVQKS